ncbi:MAG: PDZ domain-containing protein [Candidatus Cloacimonetes bacterium]|nr:PDZ domain-containing protein [Candidatus Cloacimonadota bacterium]
MKAKQLTLVITALFLMSTGIFVQNTLWAKETSPEEVEQGFKEVGKAVAEKMREKQVTTETPFMGVYLDDLDFEDAYEMHYDYNYGVLLDGIVKGGSADKAGLMKGDIIMEFDGVKARYEDRLRSLIKSKHVGDKVEIKYFRDEKIMTTTLILGSRKPKKKEEYEEITEEGKVIRKKKLSVGYGGGSWIPVWYVPKDKFDDINHIITSCGFTKLREDGLFLNGGGGKGMIGKGWFIGGMGAGYSIDRKIGLELNDTLDVTRRMVYSTGYGGVTLDKRIPISRKLISAIGFMLGWGGNTLEISQTRGDYEWTKMETQLESSNNNYIKMVKNYIMFQPKIACLYRINEWLGFRAELGYMLSYSYNTGWNAEVCGDTFEIKNSPETSYDGYTFTIGPWFGF